MTITITRRAWLRGIAIAAASAAIGATGPAVAQQTLKFGLAMPLSGSQSTYGKDQVKAAEWAVADINAKGGGHGPGRAGDRGQHLHGVSVPRHIHVFDRAPGPSQAHQGL